MKINKPDRKAQKRNVIKKNETKLINSQCNKGLNSQNLLS